MRRISSKMTFFTKKVFPIIWFGFVAFFFYSIWMKSGNLNTVQIIFLVLFCVIGFITVKRYAWILADEVSDGGDFLLVKKGSIEEKVKLDNIININFERTNPPRIVLMLRNPGQLGSEIFFSPISSFSFSPFAKNAVAEDLIRRIDKIRTS